MLIVQKLGWPASGELQSPSYLSVCGDCCRTAESGSSQVIEGIWDTGTEIAGLEEIELIYFF